LSRPDLPDPSPIMALSTAYWGSQALLTASRVGLFGALAEGPLEAAALSERLDTKERPTRLLARACVALGLLEEGPSGFRNGPLAAAYLVPGSPAYMGNALRYSDNLYATWGELETALREDRPVLAEQTYLGDDRERTRAFVYGMHDRAMAIGQALVHLVDLGERRNLLDIGGGPGTYSALLARRYPGLRCRVLDLPDVVALADEILAGLGARESVQTVPGDYRETAFPSGNDVVLISGVLHRETEAGCRDLIGRAAAALEPDGLLLVSDVFTDAGGNAPPFATLFGINMLLTAPDGGVHADAAVAGWMAEAGLTDVATRAFPPPMPHRLVVGRKPAGRS
jgi:SAM-dependent methyltransferase